MYIGNSRKIIKFSSPYAHFGIAFGLKYRFLKFEEKPEDIGADRKRSIFILNSRLVTRKRQIYVAKQRFIAVMRSNLFVMKQPTLLGAMHLKDQTFVTSRNADTMLLLLVA